MNRGLGRDERRRARRRHVGDELDDRLLCRSVVPRRQWRLRDGGRRPERRQQEQIAGTGRCAIHRVEVFTHR
jgi:hypothetical protein